MKKIILFLTLLLIWVIRVVDLSQIPNGFAWDEMDNAYQAYSLVKTGKDIFGNPLPVLLHAFADYKSSLFIYYTVPFVKFRGPDVLAARLPAAVWGVVASIGVGV